jgi:hypothetical protein
MGEAKVKRIPWRETLRSPNRLLVERSEQAAPPGSPEAASFRNRNETAANVGIGGFFSRPPNCVWRSESADGLG